MSLLSDTLKSIHKDKTGVSSGRPKKRKKVKAAEVPLKKPKKKKGVVKQAVVENLGKVKKFKKKKKKYAPAPLVVVKKDLAEGLKDDKLQKWLSTSSGFLEGLTKVNDYETSLYDYQIAHLNNRSRFRICNKARQIGWSFACNSGEALAKSHLKDQNTSIFISYNKDEASEKILHVKALYESIPLAYQKKRVVDNKHSQVFRNSRGQLTRIISTAQRPPRGKGFNTDVYFDEFAFWQWPDKIYTASVPVITRGDNGPNRDQGGVITIGSTPLGAKGKFYELLTQVNTYPDFTRQFVPWWHCPILCNDIVRAFREAPGLATHDRVKKFGNGVIPMMLASMPLDDFQQEYELAFIDENVSYFPFHIVNACVYGVSVDDDEYDEIADAKNMKVNIEKYDRSSIERKYGKIKFFECKTIEELGWKVNNGSISPNLFAGYDVGRRKDKSELTVIEEIEVGNNLVLQVVRFRQQLALEKFEVQKTFLRSLMNNVPIRKLAVDAMGLGMNLAEDLATEFPGLVDEVTIEGEWKDRAAQSLKIRFENQLMAIPDDDMLKRQIRSIKKKVSDIGTVRYDAEKDKEHHGDKFWSLALASIAGTDAATMNIGSGDISAGGRFLNPLIPDKKVKLIEGQNNIMVVQSNDIYNFEIPGIGSIPSPISNLLTPGDFNPGSAAWSSGFHMPIRLK